MKKINVTISIICLMLIINTNFVIALSYHPSPNEGPATTLINNNDWNDGCFSGIWVEKQTNDSGQINGVLNLGRNPLIGVISGNIYTQEQGIRGIFQGFFFHKLIYGSINLIDDNQEMIFIGKITFFDDDFFDIIIQTSTKNTYHIFGNYNYSFLPDISGPYHIGIRDSHLIDTNRMEKYTSENNDDYREMMIRIWYPISKQNHQQPHDYMDYVTFQWLKNRSPLPLITIPNNAYQFIRPHYYLNESIINSNERFPLIIFSPGYDGNYEIYTSFIENLVSNGFIVTSINHPYVSGITVFPDGRTISAAPIESFSLQTVVDDIYFVLDHMLYLNETDQMLKGMIDKQNIGVFGHSFGGAASLQVLSTDDRFKAGLTLDGAFYSSIIPSSFEKPIMIQLAENSFATNTTNLLWEVIETSGFKIIIKGSSHYAFTDVGLLLDHLLPAIPPNLLGFGTIEPKRMVNITRSLELPFFQVYLKNYPLQILLNALSEFDEIIVETKI